MSTRIGQLLNLVGAANFIIMFFLNIQKPTAFVATSSALVASALRGGDPAAAGRVTRFGLLRDGCKLASVFDGPMVNGTAVSYYYPPVLANGYYWVTSNESAALDPVRWSVWASPVLLLDASGPWTLVGASGGWKAWSGLFESFPYPTPFVRGITVNVDMRLALPSCTRHPPHTLTLSRMRPRILLAC